MNDPLARKRNALTGSLRLLERVVVAYSGGVDSALLAAIAHETLGSRAEAVTAVSPSLARSELSAASELAERFGWNHRIIETHEVEREDYARNSTDRCYWCKTELFEVLDPLARAREATLLVGTNLDDLGDFRPGLRAAGENGVRAPLADAELSKSEIRALSEQMGLPTAEKPASPCLASRFAYGVRVTRDGLRRIDRAEDMLRALGFEVLRVRDHGDLARIEVPAAELGEAVAHKDAITKHLLGLGFKYVSLDLVGFRSGSMNEVVLPLPDLRRR